MTKKKDMQAFTDRNHASYQIFSKLICKYVIMVFGGEVYFSDTK